MRQLHFKVAGLTEKDVQRWKKLTQPSVMTAKVLLWTTVALAVIYAVNQDFKKPPPRWVVQTVPPNGSSDVPVCTPSIFFLNQTYEGNIEFSLQVSNPQGKNLNLTRDSRLIVLKSNTGNPIVILAPSHAYPEGATVTGEIWQKDTSGNKLFVSSMEFTTAKQQIIDSATKLDFEQSDSGFSAIGDVDFVMEKGDVKPREGVRMAALSTGSVFGKSAVEGTSSLLSIGPIKLGSKPLRLEFDYNFISSEFDKYVGTEYDDAFLLILSGPGGAEGRLVTSINQIGRDRSSPITFPGMPEDKELPPQHTGWQTFSVSVDVGSPACITFVITDVGDKKFTSVVTIDALQIE